MNPVRSSTVKQNIIFLYIHWHFVELPRFLIYIWSNIIFFVFNYFTIYGLGKTFFWPYKGYRQYFPKPFNFGKFFEMIVFNIFSRIIGFLLRLSAIIVGLFTELIALIIGSFIFILCFLWPLILAGVFVLGIKLFFQI